MKNLSRSLPVLLVLGSPLLVAMASPVTSRVPAAPEPADRDFFYVPATMGVDPATDELADGVAAQVRRAMDNIRLRLAAEGMDFSHVVRVNVYLSDTRHFRAMNDVYRTYFLTDPPTRATVGVDLPRVGAMVQISMVAARPHVTRQVIRPTDLMSPELPYSWGIMAGNTLFIAGATSRDPDTYQPVTGDIGTQTRRVFGNIGAILRAAGMDYGQLASCNVFMTDTREFGGMNRAYAEFVGDDPPARATVQASLANVDFKVEIQCIAERGTDRTVVVAEGGSRPRSPYSPGISVSSRLYTAGTLGRGPDGYAPGDPETQTRITLRNLQGVFAAAGMDFGDVNDIQVWVPLIGHARAVGQVLDEVVGEAPTRTVVGAGLVGSAATVEIMMFAGGN